MRWPALRPLFQSMLFELGYREVMRRTELSADTVYTLANDAHRTHPHRRTLRDVELAVREWRPEAFSDSERGRASVQHA